MSIALYHFHVTQIKRSAGQSAIASAAYRSGEKLHSEYYGEDSDYTKKGGVICSEILLPPYAPPSFSDRETLWNEVERIEEAGCRTRKDSTKFVDTLITASPEFFKGKSPKTVQAFFQRAGDFLIDRVGRENIISAVVHMDEKTPHLHLTFVPLTEDNRLCAKEIIGNRKNLTKWQDDFFAYMVEKYPDLERGESASKTGRKHIPTRLFKQAVSLSKEARQIEKVLDEIGTFNSGNF